jgi:serine/threonine-protein kinase
MEALYHAALETRDEAREALLAQADPEMRRRVEALLANADVEEGALDRPAWEWSDGREDEAEGLTDPPSPPMQPGERLGPYQIEMKVGAGGMGEVYRATDTRLNRVIAVKVCRTQFTQRFEREAKAIAALNHPNICQIYDVGPNYLVMEWVDGSPIVRAGQSPMALHDALRLAEEIVSAMAAAHAKGIIHRDLKPANILVSQQGVAKLLDFGVARQIRVAGLPEGKSILESLTLGGLLIGTPAYMSPEQAECNNADERSDIFSFGAVLYEMLSGRRAFPGTSTASVLGAILHRPPDRLDAPPALAGIVFRCLAKSPSDRYQSANDLLADLREADLDEKAIVLGWPARWRLGLSLVCGLLLAAALGAGLWVRAHTAHSMNSIAVLPLDIESKDPDAEYISDGISGSLNNSLTKLAVLKVIPNSVTLQYKGKAADFQQIGKALGVDAVVSGNVVQRGDDLLIRIELDDVRSGKQIWGQQYARKVTELLEVQNDLAREVSQKLQLQLSEADRQKLSLGSTTNPDAYQLFLKGEHYTAKFTKEGFNKGINYLNQAIALDPNYSEAYSELAYNYINQDDWFIDPKDAAPKARAAAQKALSLDETDAQAHVALAIENQWYEWDWGAAEREFKRAIELDPGNGDAYGYYSWFLPSMLRDEQALDEARQGLKLYPLSTGLNGNLGSVMVFAHQWDKAIEQLNYSIDLDPNYWFDYCFLGRAYEQKGRYTDAIETFQRGIKLEGNIELWSGLGHAYAASGHRAEAQKVLEHLNEMSANTYIAPYNVAVIYAGLGDRDKAFEWLNRAYDARSYLLAVYLNTDARLDNLHEDPRFGVLRSRIGLPARKAD